MSNRFVPSGESRYAPRDRDRSPPRFERRGSNQHGSPIAPRNTDNSYRPGDLSASSSNPRDGPRDPPRGPRNTHDGGRGGSYAPRGRGYGARESRDGQFSRRDTDRDWQRRDTFDRRTSPPVRTRSRTPPAKDYREARDSRDLPGRDLDMSRVTRNARDTGPSSATSANSDSPFSAPGYYRGSSFRGRGRGDWDSRGRGRGHPDDRDAFRPRSRSRDRVTRDSRDFRDDRSREHDRDSSRREDDKRSDWDRDGDRFRRDPPLRPDSRNSTGSQHNSAPPSTASGPFSQANKPGGLLSEGSRRSSFAVPQSRPDLSRNTATPQPPLSPAQAVQVPMFGTFNPSAVAPTSKPLAAQTSPKETSPTPNRADVSDPLKAAPKAPKAELNTQPPTGPKAALNFQRRAPLPLNSPGRGYDLHHDPPMGQSPSVSRFSGPTTPSSAQLPSAPSRIRAFPPWGSPELGSRPLPSGAPTSMQGMQGPDASFSSATLANTSPRIPTGPRASQPSIRAPMNSRGSKPSAMTWVNPNLQRPSIMSSMHAKTIKKDDETVARPSTSSSHRDTPKGIARTFSTGSGPAPGALSSLKPDIQGMDASKLEIQIPSEATSTRAGSPEDEDEDAIDEDEDNMDLDQEDFEEREGQFVKEMDALRAKMAPSPTSNPTLLVLLEELDALASAAEDLENGVVPPPIPKAEEPSSSAVPASMPTPPNEAPSVKKTEEPIQFKQEQVNELIDLPLEGLPFLANGIPTPISEVDYVDAKDCEEQLCQRIRESLAVENKTDDDLREEFARLYESWRMEIDALDEEKRAVEEAEEKRALTPLPEIATESVSTPAAQSDVGGRRGLFADDKDLQKILDLTKTENDMKTMQAAQDAQEKPDPYREASIPEMLTLEEEKVYMFEDVNNKVSSGSTLQTFKFVPPTDDFNNDEQELFKEAYAVTPKKWGHIADFMNKTMEDVHKERGEPDNFRQRDFHDCIRHYYLTKKEYLYKNLPNRRGRKRKGMRGGRKPAASALMGSAMVDDTSSPNKLTETGRPRRQAAPDFNTKDKKENETAGRGTSSRGRGGGVSLLNKPTATASETAPEKTPGRRGRGANKDRGAKRGGKPLNLAPNVSPAKKPVDFEPASQMESSLKEGVQARDMETARVLAGFKDASTIPQPQPQPPPIVFSQTAPPEDWRVDPQMLLPGQAPQVSSMLPQQVTPSDLAQGRVLHTSGPNALQAQQPITSSQLPTQLVTQGVPQMSLQQPQQPVNASQAKPGAATQPIPAPAAKQNQGGRAAGTTSYWSVQEQQDFEALVKHYGRDWEAIARELPAKTETMIKNYFMRQLQTSNRQEIEESANEADKRIRTEGPPAPLLDPQRIMNTGAGTGNPGRRRQTVNSASQRTLAPNPDQVQQDAAMPPQAEGQNGAAASQVSPNDRGHPRLAIAPQRQIIAPSTTAAAQAVAADQAIPVARIASQTQQLRPAGREILQNQAPPIQPTSNQAAQQPQAASASHFIPDGARDAAPPSVQPSTKRPRSQTEQELLEREQPPKRQGVGLEVFSNALAAQHEQRQQQQQQRLVARNEPPQPYDYRGSRQQQPIAPQQQASAPIMRTASNEEMERLTRTRALQPSVSPREYRRDSFGPQQYVPPSIQPNIQPPPQIPVQAPPLSQTAMQAAMQARPAGGSPAQRTPPELSRPSSVPAPVPIQPPSRPTSQAPAKRSNLMSLLNDEPSEPPPRKAPVEIKPPPSVPPPRHNSPLTQASMYQAPSQPAPYTRRDIMIDPVRDSHQNLSSRASYAQQAYGSPASQPMSYREPSQQGHSGQPPHQQPPLPPQHQPSQHRENMPWPPSGRSYYPSEPIRPVEPPRPVYQPTAASPPPASSSAYIQPSRSTYASQPQQQQQPVQQQQHAHQHPHADGPSHTHASHAHSHAHSRASSYSSLHPNAPGQSSAGPGQALNPSPYASIQPYQQSARAHQPPPPPSPQHPSYYASGPGPGSGRSSYALGMHETERRGAREEAMSAPRRYTPTQTPPSGGAYGGYPPPPPPPPQQGGHGGHGHG